MSCSVGRRHGSDPALLWLWHRPAAAAPTQPLAWELPCAVGMTLKSKKKEKRKRKRKKAAKREYFKSSQHREKKFVTI